MDDFNGMFMQGSFTGPRIIWSGASLRTEATGYGLVCNISFLPSVCLYAWACASIVGLDRFCTSTFAHPHPMFLFFSSMTGMYVLFFVCKVWWRPLRYLTNKRASLESLKWHWPSVRVGPLRALKVSLSLCINFTSCDVKYFHPSHSQAQPHH